MGTLSNGMTYYIKKNAKPEQKLELRLVVNAGSILEDEKQLGLAQFMKHDLMFCYSYLIEESLVYFWSYILMVIFLTSKSDNFVN